MNLQVPRRYEAGLLKLLRCPQEQFDMMFVELEQLDPVLSLEELATQLSQKVNLPSSDIRDILSTVGGLYLVLEDRDVTRESLVDDVCDALADTESPELHLEGESIALFRERLTRALSCEDVLGICVKGVGVKSEHERLFCSARALADVRPVFPLKSEGSPQGFLILHTLRIRYHEGASADTNDFYVTLDRADVDSLLSVLQRAKRKEDSLKIVFDKANLSVMQAERGCE